VKREIPQIVKDAQRARVALEQAFTRMARRHKYTVGVDVRVAAKAVVVAALSAWRDRENRLARAGELCAAVDLLKLELQLGKDVDAFGAWREFEAIVRLVDSVGRQSGGWLRDLKPKGQNEAGKLPHQRAQKLSSRPASAGAST
jgi:hypothetical protein